jgi:mannose-6-phosphate isomerase-like protein (cupin superfamily)
VVLVIGKGERITGEGDLGVALLADIDQIGAVEVRSTPGGIAPPLHLHRAHAEAFFVLEGELTFRLEDGEHRVGADSWVFVPPEVVHTFAVTGDERARFLDIHVPSSAFGNFVRGLQAAQSEDELRAVRAAFDQQPAPEYAAGDPGLVVIRRAGGASGVGSTESHRRRLAGAGRDAEMPASPAPERERSAGAGFAGAGAEKGETITDRPGRRVTILVDADELVVTEFFYGPGERGAKPHVHYRHADGFVVVEGEFTFAFRDGSAIVPAGTLVLFPPGVVHGFDNDSAESARCFNLHMPSSGFGDYLRGRNPDFDQHEPPGDGGVDPVSIVVVRLSQ